ncbi:MAG: rhamnan synthesis F family protein [Propionibacteriaceae bacterium]|nr:rhamnan synthesis F family protein [Propionibacteriaceae bacterium]
MTEANDSTRVMFYAHFNKFGRVDDYVVYQLEQMRRLFDKVVMISNSPVCEADEKRLAGVTDKLIQRKNLGYDFAAWRDGMDDFGWDTLVKCEQLTLMNDTCFGPLFDFGAIFDQMQSRGADFWGMTTNIALTDVLLDSRGRVTFAPTHLQSYFMTFNQNVVQSEAFRHFWASIEDFADVLDVITNYEIRLTELLAENGFTYDSFFDAPGFWGMTQLDKTQVDISAQSTGDMAKYNPGYTCCRPLWLLETVDTYPFIKTKAIRVVPAQWPGLREFIIKHTDYPVQLIDTYIGARYFDLWKEKDDDVEFLLHTRAYRLGRALLGPLRFVKRTVAPRPSHTGS